MPATKEDFFYVILGKIWKSFFDPVNSSSKLVSILGRASTSMDKHG